MSCWVQISSEDIVSCPARAHFHGFVDGTDDAGEALIALRACHLSATPYAMGGMFAAVCTSPDAAVCTFCTDFMGRQPLYYRLLLLSTVKQEDSPIPSRGGATWTLQLQLQRPANNTSTDTGEPRWLQHPPRTRLVWGGGGALQSAHVPLPDILTPPDEPSPTLISVSDAPLAAAELAGLLRACVAGAWRATGGGTVGVLFSGGVDSCLVAKLLSDAGAEVHLFTAGVAGEGLKQPEDLIAARAAAQLLGLPLHEAVVGRQEVGALLEQLVPAVEDLNVVKAGVAATMALACRSAASCLGPGPVTVFSGLGTEECWAGYLRFATAGEGAASSLGLLGLQDMWHRDLQRDHAAASSSSVNIVHPFLDKRILSFALGRVPGSLKLGTDGSEKMLLRMAAESLGLPPQLTRRPKKAAQYGSRVHYALDRLRPRVYGGQKKITKVGSVMGLPGASHSVFALLAHGAAGAAHALRTCRLLRIPLACVVIQDGIGPVSEAACRVLAAIDGLPVDDAAGISSRASLTLLTEPNSYRSSLVQSLERLASRWPIAGIITCGVSDLCAQSTLARACDAAGLKVVAPVWGASPPGRLLVQTCSEGQEAYVLRAPSAAVACGALPLVLKRPSDAQRFTECVEEAHSGSSDPDSGLTELLILPAGNAESAMAAGLPAMALEKAKTMRPWDGYACAEVDPVAVTEVAVEIFHNACHAITTNV